MGWGGWCVEVRKRCWGVSSLLLLWVLGLASDSQTFKSSASNYWAIMTASVTLVAERDKVLILMERRATCAREAMAVRAASGWCPMPMAITHILADWEAEKGSGTGLYNFKAHPLQLGPTSHRLTTPPMASPAGPQMLQHVNLRGQRPAEGCRTSPFLLFVC